MRDKNKSLEETVLLKCLSIIINSTLLSQEINLIVLKKANGLSTLQAVLKRKIILMKQNEG